ncbi:hypothetical protein Angca_003475, partial [Angiostrongylus cantonensis]
MTVDKIDEVLARFGVCKEFGFLTRCDLTSLPEFYRPWIDTCDNMIHLIKENRVRDAVHSLPELTIDNLITYEDWRTAHLLLVTITSGYIWSGDPLEAPLILPRNLGTPLVAVSERLGLRPVICHASACLANWNLIDPSLPFSLDNLQLNAFKFLDSKANHWFFTVTAQRWCNYQPSIFTLILSHSNARMTFSRMAVNNFGEIVSPCLTLLLTSMLMRSFLVQQSRELILGMEEKGPLKYGGGSAAQSSAIQLIDAFLRVEHSGDERRFLMEQREHMPREHRELIYWVEAQSPIHNSIEGRQRALDALVAFRSTHLNLVSQFILTQIERHSQTTGTGGSSFIKFLKNVRAD